MTTDQDHGVAHDALTGRVAIVTGGARGIGRAISDRLAAGGASVAVNYRSGGREAEAAAVVGEIVAGGGRAIAVRADVSVSAEVSTMVDQVARELGPPTILVNNAALTRVHGPWTEIDEQDWERVLANNTTSAFLCCRATHSHMVDAGWGRIISIGSVTFLLGQANLVHYVAAKGALVGFTRSLARAVGSEGITVNGVSPGAIDTEMEREVFAAERDQIAAEQAARQAIPRRGVSADIAGVVAFLASDEASFITGQLINVDGGWAMH